MERISIFVRTKKVEGEVKLRFRLRDGRSVDLYHKSEWKASLVDLEKFDDDGAVRPRVSVFNKELKERIDVEMEAMRKAYARLCERMEKGHINGTMFEEEVERMLHPDVVTMGKKVTMTLTERFERFVEEAYRDGLFGKQRWIQYRCVLAVLKRFLVINNLKSIALSEFTADMLMNFRYFVANEWMFVGRYTYLYIGVKKISVPQKRRETNTVVSYLKKVQAFFNELEDRGEISASPFRSMGRKRKLTIMRERYDEPVFLLKEELRKVIEMEVPEELEEARECFVLQCSLGCRISDFKRLSLNKIAVTDDGIAYVHYLPQKTLRENVGKVEVETPLVRYALRLIKKSAFNYAILNNTNQGAGYNAKIKQLLKLCGIDRLCKSFDEERCDNVFRPLHEFGCSKLCRKTHVDMMSKVQINQYAAALHKEGSPAVMRYTNMSLRDRFVLMCAAFGEPLYRVDEKLEEMEWE